MRNREEILEDIKKLVREDGFFYALCMILTEDFVVNAELLQDLNMEDRVSNNEAMLLLWFLVQNNINLIKPTDSFAFIDIKKQVYWLLKELHESFHIPFIKRLEEGIKNWFNTGNYEADKKAFFWSWEMLQEPIFYAWSWLYDFQFTEYLERKYKYDKDWLLKNKCFDIEEVIKIVYRIKELLHKKTEKIHFKSLKERNEWLIQEIQKKFPKEDVRKWIEDIIPMMEIHQYVELFFEWTDFDKNDTDDTFRQKSWNSFYEWLIDLLVIRKSELSELKNIDAFFDNFSTELWEWINLHFTDIWKFNILSAKPIIKLDEDRYFVPIIFKLFEAIYETPYYWMIQDNDYKNVLSENRWNSWEEITYDFLSQVFWSKNTFRWVRVKKWKEDVTDIDVLCILWSKALCIQVKSKKLRELSRMWDTEKLLEDFKWAVQDAYNQWLKSRKAIIDKDCKLFDKDWREIKLSEKIDEAYILWITTENYPSLVHQANILLEKDKDWRNAMFLSIFDLELLVHYLKDPYDFMYYIRQRIDLMNYFLADEEIVYLWYHLHKKLWKLPNADLHGIDKQFWAILDRNYYPYKLWLPVSDKWDVIKNRWKNERLDKLLQELKSIQEDNIVDIIFSILDLSWETRDGLMDMILKIKSMTSEDSKDHNFSLQWCNISYISSWSSDDLDSLNKAVIMVSEKRKYREKSNVWIWLWSLKDSKNIIDSVFYHKEDWVQDDKLDDLFKDDIPWTIINTTSWKKLNRKSPCPCWSWKKFKRCCWDKYFW